MESYLLFVNITPREKISFVVACTFFLGNEMVFHGEMREERQGSEVDGGESRVVMKREVR